MSYAMSSSSVSLTHREYVDKWLALSVVVTTFVGYVSSVYWERTWGPRVLLRREIALENEIDRLEREADAVCTTSKLYEHSRLMRTAVVLRRELLLERRHRYRYEVSIETIFSPISTLHSVRRGFNAKAPADGPSQAAPSPPQLCTCPAPAGDVTRSAPNSLEELPVAAHAAQHRGGDAVVPPSQLCLMAGRLRDLIRYNLLAAVKYLLRFGHLLVYLYVFGRRPGMVVVPPSIEESTHFYVREVVIPYLFGVAMYGPTILFVPGQSVARNRSSEEEAFTNISLARLGDDLAGSCVAGGEGGESWQASAAARKATTITFVKRYNAVRLCASNDLIWWFFCCLSASYLVMRVFASYG